MAFCKGQEIPQELDLSALLAQFQPGDLLVLNESKVIPARIFSKSGDEILFLKSLGDDSWEVLYPARDHFVGQELELPGGVRATLTRKGLPQELKLSESLKDYYFLEHGEMALPPYIQSARGERHNKPEDRDLYQAAWAQVPGSVAAPTASLHFNQGHLDLLQARGVQIGKCVLHVGAGTFMPIRANSLEEHQMHAETVLVPTPLIYQIERTRVQGGRIWALGTTVARTLESLAGGILEPGEHGFEGETRLFIRPGYEFELVDVLMTNFHQPKSTLLCLVSAFAGLDVVKRNYAWAIQNQFQLFSYGDLSVWTNP